MRTFTTLLLLAVVAVAAPAARADACNWTAGSFTDGDPTNDNNHWENPANWSCGHAPGAGDTATIPFGTVALHTSRSVQAMNLSGGSLTLLDDPTLTVGQLDWTGGSMGGGLIVVQNLLVLSGPATKRLVAGADDATLRLDGSGSWLGGDLSLEGAFIFHINGMFSFGGAADVRMVGEGAEVVNAGTLRKTSGPGETDFFVPVTNTGTINVLAGALRLRAGGTLNGGTYTAAAGASLLFTAGTFRAFYGTLHGDPAGVVGLESDEGAPHVKPTFDGTGARLDFGGGGLVWREGYFRGTWTNAGTLALATGTDRSISGIFRNEGTVSVRGGNLRCNYLFENAPGATFNLLDESDVLRASSAARFVNHGVVRKAEGHGTSDFQDLISGDGDFVENHPGGVLLAERGTLAFSGGLDHRAGAEVRGTAAFAPGAPGGTGTTFAGDVSPGPYGGGTANFYWSGDYRPQSTSTFIVELGGVGDWEFDYVEVDVGVAVLDGTLDLRLVGGYRPAVGQVFPVLWAKSVSGMFDEVLVPPGYAFDVAITPMTLEVTVTEVPPVTVAMEPVNQPVVIPDAGGRFSYQVTLNNVTGQQQTFEAWTEAVLPSGTVYRPVEGPVTLRLSPNQTLGPLTLRLSVPASAPGGTYTYRLRVGRYPDTWVAEASFTFEKQGAALPSGEPWAFAGSGFMAAPASASSEAPAAYALHAATPNPFAERATLRYDLPEASPVRLAVYDLLGREVAVLADGEAEAGTHEAVLDGRAFAAGVYVVRLTAGTRAFTRRVTLAR